MHEVLTDIDRPPEDLVEAFEGIPTAVLSDVMGKREHTMDHEIKPVYEPVSIVGSAVTVDTYPADNLMIHRALQIGETNDVLVVDADGYKEAGLWGELMSTSALAHGLNGTIVDGAVRDVVETAELRYPVYARAVCPKGSYKGHPGSINVPVTCGGLVVQPGDIIVGDNEGVVAVPQSDAEHVLEQAQAKLQSEDDKAVRIENGEYFFDLSGLDEAYDRLDIDERSG